MGAQLRIYRRRIRSVKATKKITRAMELISASRIVKAQNRVSASTPYANELTRAVSAVATYSNTKHPLTTASENPKRAAVLIITNSVIDQSKIHGPVFLITQLMQTLKKFQMS